MIRAKFRCLSLMTKYDGMVIAALAPVKRTGKDQENDTFWKYSPNGDCELHFFKECPIEVGAYYYVDMQRAPEGAEGAKLWSLSRRDEQESYVNVELSWYLKRDWQAPCRAGMLSGRFKVGLSVEAAVAREEFKPTNSLWEVSFVFAEPSDQE